MNVTAFPVQTGFADAAIVRLASKIGFTVIVIVFEVAGLPVKQGAAFDVNTHVTMSPFTNVALV